MEENFEIKVLEQEVISTSIGVVNGKKHIFITLRSRDSFEPTNIAISYENANRLLNDLLTLSSSDDDFIMSTPTLADNHSAYAKIMR